MSRDDIIKIFIVVLVICFIVLRDRRLKQQNRMPTMTKYLVKLSAMYLSIWGGFFLFTVYYALVTFGIGISQAFLGIFGITLLATSIGIFRLKAWARISVFLISGIALAEGARGIVRLISLSQTSPNPEFLWTSGTSYAVFLIVIPLLNIILYSRKSTAALFAPKNI